MKKNVLPLIILSLLTIFTSCQNFINGGSLKQELEEVIDYATSPKTEIFLETVSSDYGDIFPLNAVLIKNQSFTVEFTQKQGIGFSRWGCQNLENGTFINDAVTIKEISVEETGDGFIKRKVEVKLIKHYEKLSIIPLCYKENEKEKPVLNEDSLHVYRTSDSKELELKNWNPLWTSEDYVSSTANALKISVAGRDELSGIECGRIYTKIISYSDGTQLGVQSTEFRDFGVDEFIPGADNTFTVDKVDAALPEGFNGVVNIKLCLVDYAGNESNSKSFDILIERELKDVLEVTASNIDNGETFVEDFKKVIRFAKVDEKGNYYDELTPFKTIKFNHCLYMNESDESLDVYEDKVTVSAIYYDEGENSKQLFDNFELSFDKTFDASGYSITRNPLKNTFIEITVKSSVGSECFHRYVVPKSMEVTDVISTSGYIWIDAPSVVNHNEYVDLINFFAMQDGKFVEAKSASLSYGRQSLILDESDKDYILYVVPYTRSTYHEDYFCEEFLVGCCLYEYPVRINKNHEIIYETENIEYPEIEFILTPGSKNSGKYNAQIVVKKNGSAGYNFEYSFRSASAIYRNGQCYDIFTVNSDNFEFFSQTYYDCSIKAVKNRKVAGIKKLAERLYGPEDNIPPDLIRTHSDYFYETASAAPNLIKFKDLSASAYSDEVEHKDGRAVLHYWLKEADVSYDYEPYSEEAVKNLEEHIYVYETDSITWDSIPVNLGKNKNYTVFFKLYDTNGNYAVSANLVTGKVIESSEPVKITKKTRYDGYGLLELDASDSNGWNYIEYSEFLEEDNKWNLNEACKDIDNHFFKITPVFQRNNSISGLIIPEFGASKYIYSPYEFAEEKPVLNKKNMIEGLFGYQIYCDQPAIVETVYCESNLENKLSLWESKALCNDAKVFKGDGTYRPDTEGIPSGNYYCVMIHFADGEGFITTPALKN